MFRTRKTRPARDVVVDRLPEWKLQAAAAADLSRRIADGQRFDFAAALEGVIGNLNPYQTQLAAASGMKKGEPDLRLYFAGGHIVFVELKCTDGKLTQSQKDRIPILRGLGFIVHIVFAATEEEMIEQVGGIVTLELGKRGSSAVRSSASWWPAERKKRA